jgi:Ser/Thr protein kinase RdoA (MazF antagonist)
MGENFMISDSLLEFSAERYGFVKTTLNFISDSTNQIYLFQKDSKDYILRFSNRPVDKINETKAEMEWLYYLAKNNISGKRKTD